MEIYVVRPGDTVDSIARLTGADLSSMIEVNQLVYPYRLAVGQALLLSSGTEKASGDNTGDGGRIMASGSETDSAAEPGDALDSSESPRDASERNAAYRDAFGSNGASLNAPQSNEAAGRAPGSASASGSAGGYAYPFISPWVLAETLPYLTELYVFSYGFTAEGDLIPPAEDDGWMVREALAHGVKPMLTLTPLGADGHFNDHLVSAAVNSQSVQLKLLRGLAGVLAEKGYAGVNIDFEYVAAADRDAFTEFVARAARLLNQFEYEVSVALAPKTSDGQPGLLYEGMDYAGLGEAADWVLLMTYEWGYTYGPPMAVAPINQVRRVVEYARNRIPAEKIRLGVPNYGYDWPFPYVRGTTKAATLGNVEAVQTAILHGAEIRFDETAQSPYFRYWQYGVQHEAWFEDVRSCAAKFRLAEEYGLSGIGVWQIMQLFRAGWELYAKR